jgi:hypothetical protein
MLSMTKLAASMVAMFALVTLTATGADEVKPIDGGKGSAFKSKTLEVKEKGEVAVVLSFEAGKEVTVTTSADKNVDVHLMVKGMYYQAKDTSPGPACLVKFTPVKGDENFTLTVKNDSYGVNKVTLKVKVED